jgi:hypothetical protein
MKIKDALNYARKWGYESGFLERPAIVQNRDDVRHSLYRNPEKRSPAEKQEMYESERRRRVKALRAELLETRPPTYLERFARYLGFGSGNGVHIYTPDDVNIKLGEQLSPGPKLKDLLTNERAAVSQSPVKTPWQEYLHRLGKIPNKKIKK